MQPAKSEACRRQAPGVSDRHPLRFGPRRRRQGCWYRPLSRSIFEFAQGHEIHSELDLALQSERFLLSPLGCEIEKSFTNSLAYAGTTLLLCQGERTFGNFDRDFSHFTHAA